MKKILFGLAMLFSAGMVQSQGLENIVVEKYYVSNAADAAGSVGTLPVGSVTYRFYVDMLPGYKFQAAYATVANPTNPAHTLSINTSTSFFNNEDRGATTPTYTKAQAAGNTVMLDSWLSVGGACVGNFGVLKSEDTGAANVVNSNGILANNDASAGIPLTTQDGLLLGATQAVTTVGPEIAAAVNVFDATSQVGGSFALTDGAWSALSGASGPLASNRVLIAQITTNGVLTYALNIQIGTPSGGVEKYVHDSPTGTEIDLPSLSGTLGAVNANPTVSITAPANGAGFITGTSIAITANAADSDGTVASVQFFVDGVSVGTDNTAPYAANYVGVVGPHTITAVATDNSGGTATSSVVNITVASNPPPTVSITAPTAGASFTTGDIVAITANAADNGSVASVQFFVDGVSIGTDNTAPYAANYTSTLGTHSLTARATDNLGLQTTSAAVSINVINNVPSVVNITSPVSGALFTAPAIVAISASASDPDGSVVSVQFFVNGVSIGTDATAPYSINWTSVIGNVNITARATDDDGAITISNPVVLSIADPNALPYALESSFNVCNGSSFCLPLNVVDAVANVIGYDITIEFDNTKVTPTGVITMASDLIQASYVDVVNNINQAAGQINISVYFNASAPASARFNGTGELFCIGFTKNPGFTSVDTANFSVSFLQESYFTGVQSKLVQDADYVTYRDTTYGGSLKLWFDNSPIRYNAANPNQYLITNIAGTNASCANPSATVVQPDTAGNFKYNTANGLNISIRKDILGTTDVQAVINGFDALLANRVLLNNIIFIPSVYQAIAMDVNLDGVISAGDVSQINQRAVLIIPEFKQAWNYNAAGVSNGQLSKDWLFLDSITVATNPAYSISTTYPLSNGIGFSKFMVPQVAFCLPVVVNNFAVCPDYTFQSYKGVLIGDVNGNVATASPSNLFKSLGDKLILNLSNAIYSGNSVEIPVSYVAMDAVNAVDFSLMLDETKLAFNSITRVNETIEALHFFNTNDRTLRFTSNSQLEFNSARPVAYVKLDMVSGMISASDITNTLAYLNGEATDVEIIGDFATGINPVNYSDVVSVFPNPANEFVQVLSPENATIQLIDAAGRMINEATSVIAGQSQKITTENLAAGVYFVRISNEHFSVMKKVVVNK